jgi:DNA end-binding protein Ku
MAVRGIWSGTVSFGLVAIPVQLVRAVRGGSVHFRMLHKKDNSPLRRRMYCPVQEAFIPPEEVIRGYEIEPDQYVPISDEELESLAPERSRTIEIIDFVEMKEVDPIFYDRPYYLVPGKGGEKPYRLLVEVLRQVGKAGLARFVLRDREYLVAIRPVEDALALITLHYSEEILPDEDIAPEPVKIDSKQKTQIKRVINRMAAEFDPGKYTDERREKIFALLKEKEKERGTVEVPDIGEEEQEEPPDLVAALEESLQRVKRGRE